jgi:Kazal-type serine protease inhibitor domain
MLKKLGYTALLAMSAAVLVIGSAATGQAKAVKKMAGPPPVICPLIYKPVCGETMGVETTYANWCFAAKNEAKIIHQGACRVRHKAMHHHKAMHEAKHAKKKAMKKK